MKLGNNLTGDFLALPTPDGQPLVGDNVPKTLGELGIAQISHSGRNFTHSDGTVTRLTSDELGLARHHDETTPGFGINRDGLYNTATLAQLLTHRNNE